MCAWHSHDKSLLAVCLKAHARTLANSALSTGKGQAGGVREGVVMWRMSQVADDGQKYVVDCPAHEDTCTVGISSSEFEPCHRWSTSLFYCPQFTSCLSVLSCPPAFRAAPHDMSGWSSRTGRCVGEFFGNKGPKNIPTSGMDPWPLPLLSTPACSVHLTARALGGLAGSEGEQCWGRCLVYRCVIHFSHVLLLQLPGCSNMSYISLPLCLVSVILILTALFVARV